MYKKKKRKKNIGTTLENEGNTMTSIIDQIPHNIFLACVKFHNLENFFSSQLGN